MSARKYIATLLHRVKEAAADEPAIAALVDKPHYVIDRRLVEMFAREDVTKSITAMIEAEVARLPFPELVIEFEVEPNVRRIMHLVENAAHDGFRATAITLSGPVLTITVDPIDVLLSIGSLRSVTPSGFIVHGGRASELDKLAAIFATAVGLLMLNTQGIEKEVIEPRALNIKREASGKPSIPRHTLLRIGTIVDRSGREVRADQARRMPIHLRAGHARRQHYGRNNENVKIVYIPPTLVNFRPGDEDKPIPHPKKLLTR